MWRTVKAEHFSDKANVRFTAFLRANRLQIGDTYKLIDYISWINSRVTYFKRKNGLKAFDSISKLKDGHRKFTEYLQSLEVK